MKYPSNLFLLQKVFKNFTGLIYVKLVTIKVYKI